MSDNVFHLFLPMYFYVLYLFALFLYAFICRFKAVKSGRVSGKYFKDYSDKANVPNDFLVLERHIDNQFQLPLLFFITCLAAVAFQAANDLHALLAWLFVASRLLHSFIHLGKNKILLRAGSYALGWIILVIFWTTFLTF